MVQNYASGWATAIKYDFETSFGTGGTPAYPFGWGTKVTAKKNNNLERIYGLGSRNSQYTVAKKFEGNLTIEFVLGNAYWLRSVLGTQAAKEGAGPYTHAFSEANIPPSLQIQISTDQGSNDMVTTYTGVVVTSAKLTMAVGEAIKCTLECLYKSESTATSGTFSAVADTFCDPMIFAHGAVSYAGQTMGNTYSGLVQNCELTVNNNAEMIYGLGSRTSQERVNKLRAYDLRMTYALVSVANSADVFPNVLGDTSAPYTPAAGNITGVDVVLTITNSGATTALRSLVWTFTAASTFLNSSSIIFDVNEVIKDDVEGWAESISTLVYTDNTSTGIGT